MLRSSLLRCLSAGAAARRARSFQSRFPSPPVSRASSSSSSNTAAADLAGDDADADADADAGIYRNHTFDRSQAKLATLPTLLQPRVVIYDGVCHLCHRGKKKRKKKKEMEMERWAGFGSALASLMFIYSVFSKYFPFSLEYYFKKYSRRIHSLVYPYIQVKIPEYDGDRFKRSEAYVAIESYLSESCSQHASKLKADFVKDSNNLVLSMDDHEEVTDEFEGVKLWWASSSMAPRAPSNPFSPAPEERR